jgi:hypothetical protein
MLYLKENPISSALAVVFFAAVWVAFGIMLNWDFKGHQMVVVASVVIGAWPIMFKDLPKELFSKKNA